MQRIDHRLLTNSLGSHKSLCSFHYGKPGMGRKVYIQASLHAEELPGMLAAYYLQTLLEQAERAGQLQGEVVLVPVANPIGLAQRLDHRAMGRFELGSSENFNRHYPDLAQAIGPTVLPTLGPDASQNVHTIRHAMGRYLQAWQPSTELQSLRRTLLLLAHDADWVLDLHCDCEAVMHIYTEEPCQAAIAPLARYLQAQAFLLARESGGGPFDECLSGVWWQLARAAQAAGVMHPIPQGSHATTVELRGEADVSHAWAQADAQALMAYLQHVGIVAGAAPAQPEPCCKPTPLAGSETLYAPTPGVVVFHTNPGQTVQAGDVVADIVDPLQHTCTPVRATTTGVMYARVRERYATAGAELAKIAGSTPFRTGPLLGA